MLVLYQRKTIFKKLFFGSLIIFVLSAIIFSIIKIAQGHVNAARQITVTAASDNSGSSGYVQYPGNYGDGTSSAQTDYYTVNIDGETILAYCGNPSALGLHNGNYTESSSFPNSYYDAIRLMIYLGSVGYSSHSSDSIMTTLFGSYKSNAKSRYALTHIAVGYLYAQDLGHLSSDGRAWAQQKYNDLVSYINSSSNSAYTESQNYRLHRIQGGADHQDLIWIEYVEPTPTLGKVSARKRSSGDSLDFSGIEFSLYDNSSCSGARITYDTLGTNESIVYFEDLDVDKTYYIKETKTNSNYTINSSCNEVTPNSSGTGTARATITNDPIPQTNPGKVRAVKTSSSSTYAPSFAGIKFSVYSSSTCTGTVIGTKTISGSGNSVTFSSDDIEEGEYYYIKEVSSNAYYYDNTDGCQRVKATETGTESIATATFTNVPIIPGKVTVIKESSSSTYTPSFAGIQFSIYSSSSCSGTPITTKTLTGSNSSVLFDTDLTEGETYYIKESIGTNTNYYTNTSCKSATATANGTESSATVTFTNNPIIPGKVTAVKQSSSSTYAPSFAGITFSLYSSSSCSGNPIETKTLSGSDSRVVFETGMEEGNTYYLKESIGTNTNYYESDTSCRVVTATANGTEPAATVTFINEPVGKVKINKCDAEANANCGDSSIKAQGNGDFNGIKFTLYNDSQCTQTTTGTGITNPQTLSNGNISVTFEKLVAGQTYYVKESIDSNTFYNESDTSCRAVTANTTSSADLEFNNTIKKSKIKVIKRDSETNSCTTVGSNSFDGTAFQLINKSTNIIYYNHEIYPPNSVIDTKTLSSGSCDVTFDNLPYGTYQISETPSNGYNGGSAQTITLSSSTTTEVTFTNTAKKGKIIINKVDADTNSCTPYNSNFSLDGTKFTLINKTNGLVYYDGDAIQHDKTIATQTLSNGVCQVIFSNLPYGEYEITEQSSFGYIPVTPTSQWATISATTETVTKTFENRFVGHSLGTVAVDGKDGDKYVEAESAAKIVDTVSYCITPGVDFVLEGTLMDKSTGEALLIDGQPVKASLPLNSETECGEVEMEFEFDASSLGGQELVVFEKLYYQDNLILEHSDINDTDQTLSVLFLKTFATNRSTRAKVLPLNEEVEIVDEVDYCLKTDTEYTLEGVVMNKSTNRKLLIDDAPVEDELTFTPTECCGQVEMSFTVNTTDLAGAELVIFENLYQDEQLVLEHNNLYNIAQTVSVETPLPAPEPVPEINSPNTGRVNQENRGINESFGVILVALALPLVGFVFRLIYRRKNRITFSDK